MRFVKNYEDSLEYFAIENNKEYLLDEFNIENDVSTSEIFKSAAEVCLWNCPICKSVYDLPVWQRTLYNQNCPFCVGKRVNETNCLWVIHPEIAKLLKDKNIGYEITVKSGKKVEFVCPDCGDINIKTIAHVTERGFSCSKCSDGLSYPEKFMISFLSQLELVFETQKIFDWALNKKYDFYIEHMIIETHGGNHYNGKFKTLNGKSLSEEQENDNLKEQLAKDNGIEEYIVIDCLHSNMNHIKNSIVSSRLSKYFNLENIDWIKCDVFASKSIIKQVCDLWNDGFSRKEIEKIVYLSYTTVIEHLKKGNSLGWCSYNARNEMLKSNRINALKNAKRVKQYSLNMEFIKEFSSIAEASKFTNINQAGISSVCNGKQKTAGNFIWIFNE